MSCIVFDDKIHLLYIISDSETDFKMRMRKKKHSGERIEACADYLLRPMTDDENEDQEKNGDAHPRYMEMFGGAEVSRAVFGRECSLELEIGCGKGDFAVGLSASRAECGIIALERVADVAVTALEKAAKTANERPDNLRFIIGNAVDLPTWFPESTFSRIYINFCDPWPKSGYAKRRLTAPGFLNIYRRLLVPNGELHFKTDNEGLFDWSLEQFDAEQIEIIALTRDLHSSPLATGNIMTEYERNFTSRGMPIYSAHLRFRKEQEESASEHCADNARGAVS